VGRNRVFAPTCQSAMVLAGCHSPLASAQTFGCSASALSVGPKRRPLALGLSSELLAAAARPLLGRSTAPGWPRLLRPSLGGPADASSCPQQATIPSRHTLTGAPPPPHRPRPSGKKCSQPPVIAI